MAQTSFHHRTQDKTFANFNIKSTQVICIDQDGKKLGQLSLAKAVELAQSYQLDLVQISIGNKDAIPVCKILDYGKYKYDLSLKTKEQAKKQRENEVKTKEIQFRPVTGENDLTQKAKHAKEFLKDGNQVKLVVKYKTSELRNKEIGQQMLLQFLAMLPEATKIIQHPNLEGKQLTCLIKL